METSTRIQAHPPLYRLAGMVLTDLWRVLKPLIVFETVFKGLALTLGTLGTAWVISPLVESTGHAAVTNTDITSFLLSPAGLLTVVLLALAFLLGSMVEHVGVITIAAAYHGGRNVTAADTLAAFRSVALRVVSFGIAKLGLLAVLGAPFVALAGLVYFLLLTGHDINYYLANHPPSWYLAVALGALLVAALGAVLAVLYVGTLFAVPILLLEKRGVRAAIYESWARTRGARAWIGSIVLGWHVVGMIAGVLVVWGFGAGARSCLHWRVREQRSWSRSWVCSWRATRFCWPRFRLRSCRSTACSSFGFISREAASRSRSSPPANGGCSPWPTRVPFA